jgi:NAD(P)H-dependent flavin oxidoreductase YrpB (nitropropane dioxygenase family)
MVVWFRTNNRAEEIKDLTQRGIIPVDEDLKNHPEKRLQSLAWLSGQVASQINDIIPAKQIVDDMVRDASQILVNGAALVTIKSKL